MIHSYFGNGKGKTTAAVGAAIRALGCGYKVLFVQFLKNQDSSELAVLKQLSNLEILVSKEHYHLYDNLREERATALSVAYQKLLTEEMPKDLSPYQMIIFDELLDVLTFGYVGEEDFLALLDTWKPHCEIILTGHQLPQKIAAVSDYISEVREVNHPYRKGVPSRKGIEY